MEGWETAQLGDISEIYQPKTISKKEMIPDGEFPVFGANGIIGRYNRFNHEEPQLLVTCRGATCGTVNVSLPKSWITGNAMVIKPLRDDLDKTYLEYFFKGALDFSKVITGAAQPQITRKSLTPVKIQFPPLEEQKRIVALLDEAFKGIARAEANAEKNLANARELFEGLLNKFFLNEGNKWKESALYEVADFKGGGTPSKNKPEYWNGDIPWVSPKDMKFDYIDTSIDKITRKGVDNSSASLLPTGSVLIVVRSGILSRTIPIGISGKPLAVNQDIKAICPKNELDTLFLSYFLRAKEQDILKLVTQGATVHRLSTDDVKNIKIPLPPVQVQNELVSEIKELSDKSQRQLDIYAQKLKNLADLKQSLLEKAFSGALTAETTDNVVAFPATATEAQVLEPTSPEFAADVLAFGYYWHEAQGKHRTYGHVKSQKFLQLAESIAGIDMGRQPVKDAAGPNDFRHMLNATGWARGKSFFKYAPRTDSNGYDFVKLDHYNTLIGKALETLKPYRNKLEKVLFILLPMNSQKAEVLATVHAAWNNLLLDGKEVTEEAIIYEARENWTNSKHGIPESEFRQTIKTIRANGIVPDGTAKRVTGQESLLL